MKKSNATALVLAGLAAFGIAATPTAVSARIKDSPDATYCKSGAHVKDSKLCKENGGKQ
jgi:hypothetical protein